MNYRTAEITNATANCARTKQKTKQRIEERGRVKFKGPIEAASRTQVNENCIGHKRAQIDGDGHTQTHCTVCMCVCVLAVQTRRQHTTTPHLCTTV